MRELIYDFIPSMKGDEMFEIVWCFVKQNFT